MMSSLEELRRKLKVVTFRVAAEAAHRYGQEGIYSFALYSDNEFRYVFATVASVVGLRQVASRYLNDARYSRKWGALEVAMRHLKWSPCDSPYHMVFCEDYEEVSEMLEAIAESNQGEDEDTVQEIMAIFSEVLREVRESSFFSDDVVLNVLAGDQSDDERIENSRPLNSTATFNQFRAEIEHIG